MSGDQSRGSDMKIGMLGLVFGLVWLFAVAYFAHLLAL